MQNTLARASPFRSVHDPENSILALWARPWELSLLDKLRLWLKFHSSKEKVQAAAVAAVYAAHSRLLV